MNRNSLFIAVVLVGVAGATCVAAAPPEKPVTVLSHDPKGTTLIQFPRRGDGAWYYAYAVAKDAPKNATPSSSGDDLKEGIAVEIRRWAGDDLNDWATVREGLTSSDNVIGNAVVSEIVENCNPVRPNDPRNYASSYRGFLNIPTDGVYRFFL